MGGRRGGGGDRRAPPGKDRVAGRCSYRAEIGIFGYSESVVVSDIHTWEKRMRNCLHQSRIGRCIALHVRRHMN